MIRHTLAAVALALIAGTISAQTASYPGRAIRIIIPFPPGATTDVLSRTVCAKLNEAWGQPCIPDNRGGAAGLIGTEIVAKSPADGYTLVTVISSHVIHPLLHKKVGFHPLNDFVAVSGLGRSPSLLIVHPAFPPRTIKEFLALARARKGDLVYGTAGTGTNGHVITEIFKRAAGITMEHIPYKGGAPAVVDLLGGQIPVMMASFLTAIPHVRAGKARALAITSGERNKQLPEVPTIAESGFPGFEGYEWWVLLAPAGTPREVVVKLNAEVQRILALPDVKERMLSLGTEPIFGTPEKIAAFLRTETDMSSKALLAAGVKSE
ncbi:MAG: tripartite tricarboxylate transporter substrate binding protein [Burkholderiales bacterium]|nr:tripartite tricarboxylate transporter substrate binding protein [Burkholderiales bacterium]